MIEENIIPTFFRMLIIDDRVAASLEYKEFFRNIFTAMVLEKANSQKRQVDMIEVVFESDPAKGFKKWHDEPFDLTLIDVDFSENRGPGDDLDDLKKYVMSSHHQGLYIYKLLEEKIKGSGSYAYRNGMCQFFLWTATDDDSVETFAKQFGIGKEKFFKKNESFVRLNDELALKVQQIFNNISTDNQSKIKPFNPEQKIERLLFAMKNNYSNLARDLSGACLLADTKSIYPFLPSLGELQDSAKEIWLYGGRNPYSPSDTTRFLPLLPGKSINVIEAITYLSFREKNKEINAYCKAVQERESKQQRLPWFPNKPETVTQIPSFIAAATPLTGTSVIGNTNAVASLSEKVAALLGPFDRVILKTTYLDSLDQWENAWWPSVQIQSHMRSRCLYPDTQTPTLWNSGKTAMETLPPSQMNELLKSLMKTVGEENTNRVVISLGSKFPMGTGMARLFQENVQTSLRTIWQRLFGDVFRDIPFEFFSIIEINFRHFLREIVHYHLGGDEYLTPRVLNEKSSSDPAAFWAEFKIWLLVIHQVAVLHRKKLIFKLPHRSDALAFVECIVSLREHHLVSSSEKDAEYGVHGVTLVNALKTPVPRYDIEPLKYTTAWYADPDTWSDASGKLYQMSGRLVGAYRNQVLTGLLSSLKILRNLGLEVWISGGLTNQNEVEHCSRLERSAEGTRKVISGIQIGTWALLSTDLSQNSIHNWCNDTSPPRPKQKRGQYKLDVSNCKSNCCNDIHESCQYSALEVKQKGSKVAVIDEEKCLSCDSWDCIKKCKMGQLTKIIKSQENNIQKGIKKGKNSKAFLPRFSFLNIFKCEACGVCSRTFYCDTFIDRANTGLPPQMDSRYCNGCGLCAQVCPSGALQLYPPENFLVLISSSRERKEILDSLKIPNLQYDPENDIRNFPEFVQKLEFIKEKSVDKCETFWADRIKKDKFMLHQDEEELYPDERNNRKDVSIKTALDLFNESESCHNPYPDHAKTAMKRAAIWSQLIWSDPGQVLWDSFILTIQSVIIIDKKPVSDLSCLIGKEFTMESWIVLLRKGDIIFNDCLPCDKKYNLGESAITPTDDHKFGFNQSRAAGLVRLIGERTEQYSISFEEKLELAGLPWEKIKSKVDDLPQTQDEHKKAFEQLCLAVSERERI